MEWDGAAKIFSIPSFPGLTSFPILGVNPDGFGHTAVDSFGD